MKYSAPATRYDFLAAAIIGAVLGTVILGIGGRIAMRIIGTLQGLPPGFSWGGTMTVVFLGAVSGAAGGIVLALSRKLFPTSRVARGALYWGALLLLTLNGLKPIDQLRLLVFFPVVALFGSALLIAWCRAYLPRASRLKGRPLGTPGVDVGLPAGFTQRIG